MEDQGDHRRSFPRLAGQPSPFGGFIKDQHGYKREISWVYEGILAEKSLVLAFDTFEGLETVTRNWLF